MQSTDTLPYTIFEFNLFNLTKYGEKKHLDYNYFIVLMIYLWWLSGYVWHFHDMFVLVFPSSIKAC